MKARLITDIRLKRGYSRGKQGKRADLNNRYFRSAWEANYARYLNWLLKKGLVSAWDYEIDRFDFIKIKRGCRSYLTDFKVWDMDNSLPYYVEIKGWLDSKSNTKLKRMAKYYPEIKILLIGPKEYKEIENKCSAFIENWE